MIIAIVIQLFRLFALYLNMQTFGLYIDEVYYWGWAQNPELGYYSKPPMIAWLIMLTTSIFGEGEIATKLGGLLVYPLTSTVIYLIAKRLFENTKIAFYSALAFITIPAISMSSIIISTDVVLLFYWALSMYFFIVALQEEKKSSWLLAGFFAGCGLLSKYNMIFFLVSVVLVLVLKKEYRKHFKNIYFYLALVIAAIVFLPNLYWQYQNDFISFAHTEEISQIDKQLFHLNKMFEFLGAQLGVFGPLFFPVLLLIIFKLKSTFKDNSMKFLYLFVIPYLLFITTLSLLSRAFANWSAPVYVAGIVLVIAFLVKNKKEKFIKISIGINILLALILYFYHPIMNTLGIEITKKNDPYRRIYGWEALAKQLDEIKNQHKDSIALFDDRKMMSEMIFYMRPHPLNSLIYNPSQVVKNQYHLRNNLSKPLDKTFLYITKSRNINYLKKSFDSVEFIKDIKVDLYKDFSREYKVYLLKNFKGYK